MIEYDDNYRKYVIHRVLIVIYKSADKCQWRNIKRCEMDEHLPNMILINTSFKAKNLHFLKELSSMKKKLPHKILNSSVLKGFTGIFFIFFLVI